MTPARRLRSIHAVALLTGLWAPSAFAHLLQAEAYGFVTGFLHPVSGADHVLAMVAVGLWGAQLGAPAIWVLPVAFPLVMAMGGMFGFLGVPIPGVEYGIAASAIVLGAAVAFEARPPWSSRRSSSDASRSSTAMRMEPSCRPAKAHCSTAWVS